MHHSESYFLQKKGLHNCSPFFLRSVFFFCAPLKLPESSHASDNDFFEDEDDEPAAESKDASADKTED